MDIASSSPTGSTVLVEKGFPTSILPDGTNVLIDLLAFQCMICVLTVTIVSLYLYSNRNRKKHRITSLFYGMQFE